MIDLLGIIKPCEKKWEMPLREDKKQNWGMGLVKPWAAWQKALERGSSSRVLHWAELGYRGHPLPSSCSRARSLFSVIRCEWL